MEVKETIKQKKKKQQKPTSWPAVIVQLNKHELFEDVNGRGGREGGKYDFFFFF